MACFLIPTAEAIVTTAVEKTIKAKEEKSGDLENTSETTVIPFSRKLKWLNNMLWGGSALLAFEHVWHGEVVPFFPFLTAAKNAADTQAMLHEMSTVGVTMAILVTVVWIGMVIISNAIEKRPANNKLQDVK